MTLISCIMLTYNRLPQFKKSFHCFLQQDYQHKELIIINNGDEHYKKEIASIISNTNNVKHIQTAKASIGSLRNIGLKYSKGEYIAVWDDDDISHNSRLTYCLNQCKKNNVNGITLANNIVHMGNTFYRCNFERGLEGTMFFKHFKDIQYENISASEDTLFVEEYSSKHSFKVIQNKDILYIYVQHDTNTIPKESFKQMVLLNCNKILRGPPKDKALGFSC